MLAKCYFVLVLSLLVLNVNAQNNNGAVIIDTDLNLNKLTDLYKRINLDKCPKLINGYRVQIFSCSGVGCTDKAQDQMTKFSSIFPYITVHQVWDPPSHKIRVGDCRNHFDAQKIKASIQNVFPASFIVPDFIEPNYFDLCEDN
jgi:hypothetical protein